MDNYSNADWDSCGRSSPVLDVGDGNACLVHSNGNVIVSGWDVEFSYGRSSPDFYYDNQDEYSVDGDGDVDTRGLDISGSYGISLFQEKISAALRTVLATAMHVMLSRMVSSTTVSATMWIGIPAGIF